MTRGMSFGKLASRIGLALCLVMAFSSVCLALQITVGGVTYQAAIQDGQVTVTQDGQPATIPGVSVLATPDGKGIQVAGVTGDAAVVCSNGTVLNVQAGECVAVTESMNGERADIQAVAGNISGSVNWTKDGTSYTVNLQVDSGSKISTVPPQGGGGIAVTVESGTASLVGGDKTKFSMDTGDSVLLSAGAAAGSVILKVTKGKVLATKADGTTKELSEGDTFVTTTVTDKDGGTQPPSGPGKGEGKPGGGSV